MEHRILSTVTIACLAIAGSVTAQQPEATIPTPLFNGKNLDGWHGLRHQNPYELLALPAEARAQLLAEDQASALAHWRVEDSELVNDGEGAYLTTDRDFRDATFALDYKTVALADSGIYLRGCPQVQIWDTTEVGGKWALGADKGSGALWNNAVEPRFPLVHADKPFGEWNHLVITQCGERVWVQLNGQETVRGVRMENYWNRALALPAKGPLQLQTHGGEIRFRNLTVHELTAGEADAKLDSFALEGFVSIFDGRSFDGWRGDTDSYEIVDGAMRCKPGQGGNLFTTTTFADFVVRLRFRLPPGGNNGLAIRYPGEGDPAYTGVELQVLDNTAETYAALQPYQYHGSVYGIAPAQRGYLRPTGQWNHQQVTVQGSRFLVELNGTRILDADIQDLPSHLKGHSGKDNSEGHFGFCGHNDPVEFKDIWVKRL